MMMMMIMIMIMIMIMMMMMSTKTCHASRHGQLDSLNFPLPIGLIAVLLLWSILCVSHRFATSQVDHSWHHRLCETRKDLVDCGVGPRHEMHEMWSNTVESFITSLTSLKRNLCSISKLRSVGAALRGSSCQRVCTVSCFLERTVGNETTHGNRSSHPSLPSKSEKPCNADGCAHRKRDPATYIACPFGSTNLLYCQILVCH